MNKKLKFESLENRDLLSVSADIVFLVDESPSLGGGTLTPVEGEPPITREYHWLADYAESLDNHLGQAGITDIRYGLIGFGLPNFETIRHTVAFSYGVIDENESTGVTQLDDKLLFGDADALAHTVQTTLGFFRPAGDSSATEDGWDPIEHAVAEYNFREGASVIFVLIQDPDGDINPGREQVRNSSLTQPGVLSALQSVDAVLNVVVDVPFDSDMIDPGELVLGVDADDAKRSPVDGVHEAHIYNPTAYLDVDTGTYLDGVHEVHPTSLSVRDDYAQLAWDTGGSAWNLNIIQDHTSNNASEVLAFNHALSVGICQQIFDRSPYFAGVPLIEMNVGGPAVGSYTAEDPLYFDQLLSDMDELPPSNLPIIDMFSEAIPEGASVDLFHTWRKKDVGAGQFDNLELDIPPSDLAAGEYIVELMFLSGAETSNFDIEIEGELYLDNYRPSEDYAKIKDSLDHEYILDTFIADSNTAITKRFRIAIDSNGLQINLNNGILNAFRVLRPGPALLGDFNGDDSVDAGDYTFWRDRLGDVVMPFTGADHSGNGIIDVDDYVIWAQHYGNIAGYLAGDYNRDGVVNVADYNTWVASYGSTVADPGLGADGNEDGVVDAADYTFWRDLFGSTLASPQFGLLAVVAGDYNQDGTVDQHDFNVWESNFGSTTNLAADGNNNGIVDLADLEIWQSMRGVTTLETIAGDFNADGIVDTADYDLWEAGDLLADSDGDGDVDQADYDVWDTNFGTVSASLLPMIVNGDAPTLEVPDAAPVVLGVQVSASAGASYDFDSAVGSGEQLRTVPVTGADTISITFSEEVFVTQNALLITNLDGTSPATVTSFNYDLGTQTASWTFDSALSDGRTLLQLSDSVYDLDHDALDGEFWGAWSLSQSASAVFPSGNGEAGGEFRFRFTILDGDSDRNNIDGATDYTSWLNYESNLIYVSNATDELDLDYSYGDLSLREAIQIANASSVPMTIQLPEGRYLLDRSGAEAFDASYNDLNISADVTIQGVGAGFSVIDVTNLPGNYGRAFTVSGAASRLAIDSLTIANGNTNTDAQAIKAENQATLEIINSAIVNHATGMITSAVWIQNADSTIRRSVFANNEGSGRNGGTAVYATSTSVSTPASITIGESVFANNTQSRSSWAENVYVYNPTLVTRINEGNNLVDVATGGFFDAVPGAGDHIGPVDYVVTTKADSFDHTNNDESLSLREAIDLSNQSAGQQEIWIPAWALELTRDRATYGGGSATDTDIAFGDLDIFDDLIIRGVSGKTSVTWKPGTADEVFDLLGDYNDDGQADYNNVSAADYTLWANTNGSGSGTSADWELFAADGDDDGDVDQDDYDIWAQHLGNELDLIDVAVI